MKKVPLKGGLFALVDDDDYGRVRALKWCASKGSSVNHYAIRNYIRPDGRKTTQSMHRFLTGAPPGKEVHHKNGNGLDNRRENMQVLSREDHYRTRFGNAVQRPGAEIAQ